jgi:WS/DGAT/MGAT family acyltransferase
VSRRTRRKRKPLGGGFWLPEVVNEAVYSVGKITGRFIDKTAETLSSPHKTAEFVTESAKGAGVLARLSTMPADKDTIFKGELCTRKLCAWSQIMPLDRVKACAKSHGATINDLLLAGVTGALRRYMEGRKAPADGLDIRAVVPVNLRPESDIIKLGNRFGLVFLSLPVGIPDRVERLQELKRRMDAIKASSEPLVIYGLLNAVGLTGPRVESVALQLFGSKATAVMTNVPGPREEIYLAGKPMRSMMFWVPQSAKLGLGVSILSYAGQVRLGVATDSGLVPDPQSIITAFQDEMEEMLGDTDC